ncbi:hypothetical protein L1987_15811 [Smallanthus sonchifolius]|uniref:Uncharacterized protein n=1 Tax=Smallanthus sonchifolius TaxID=185202 RepID=A0ACB9J8T0_9ASTR|nr:hypothetical protein L1987_15811 [Smallanthus sonchifolius]
MSVIGLRAAVDESIIVGGGCTLLRLASKVDAKVDAIKETLDNDEEKVGVDIVKRAMSYPLKLIAKNACVMEALLVKQKRSEVKTVMKAQLRRPSRGYRGGFVWEMRMTVIKLGHVSSYVLAYGATDETITICTVSEPPSVMKKLTRHSKDITGGINCNWPRAVLGTSCDVCAPNDVRKLANFVVNKLGSIDIWINNVGTTKGFRTLLQFSNGDIEHLIRKRFFFSAL